MKAPTFISGFRIKSMKDIFREAVVTSYYRLLQSKDMRLKEIIRVQVTQFLEDTNINLLDPGENPANNQPKVFFFARADVWFEEDQSQENELIAKWILIPRDEMPPRLQIETGRTLLALLYQFARKYQIAISLDNWYYYNGYTWILIKSIAALKKILRDTYLNNIQQDLSEEHHWKSFKPEEAMSTKSYRWTRQLPVEGTPGVSKAIF